MDTLQIANTIAQQLGRQAQWYVGTKRMIALGEDETRLGGLRLNCTKGRYIEIALNGSDLYDVRVFRLNKSYEQVTLVSHSGIFCDTLADVVMDSYDASLSKAQLASIAPAVLLTRV